MKNIIAIHNVKTGEYFFTTDHCQDHNLGEDWVPVTYNIPHRCRPRIELPSGVINNKEEWKMVYALDKPAYGRFYKEIPNPQPEFQA